MVNLIVQCSDVCKVGVVIDTMSASKIKPDSKHCLVQVHRCVITANCRRTAAVVCLGFRCLVVITARPEPTRLGLCVTTHAPGWTAGAGRPAGPAGGLVFHETCRHRCCCVSPLRHVVDRTCASYLWTARAFLVPLRL